MSSELRDSGINVVGDVPWGTHFCHFYETKQDLLDTLVPYFKAGLENNECCLWVVSDDDLITVEEARTALAHVVPDLDRQLSLGKVEILSGHQWYHEKNALNLERVRSAWHAKLKQALARGSDGLRVSGDTFWLADKDWKDFCAYEKQLNDSITGRRMTILCTYPLGKSGAAEVLDVMNVHQFAAARRQGEWQVIQSPESARAKAEVKRLNEDLERIARKTPEPPFVLRYVVAVLAVIVALIINRLLNINLVGAPAMLFLCALMFSAWYGGAKPALLAMPIAVMAFAYYFVTPVNSFAVDVREIPRLSLFVLASLFVISLSAAQKRGAESLRRARDVLAGTVEELKRANHALGTENTERKQAEARLHAKEQEFRAIVENAPDHIARYDREFRRVYANPSLANAYGLPVETLIGKPMFSIIREAGLAVEEEYLSHIRQRYADVFDTGKSYEFQVRVPMPTGTKDYSVRIFPEFDLNGSVVNVLSIARDITASKRAEEELKREKEVLEKIFDNIPVMIGFVGQDGRVKLVNPEWERTIGWTLKELQEHNVDIFAEAYPDLSYRQEVLDFVAAATGEWVDLKIKARNGAVIDAACAVVRLSDGRRVAIAQNITERKGAEEALRRSEDHLRLVIETIPVMTWSTKPDGVVDFLSKRWTDYAGISLEKYTQDPNGPIHPDDMPRVTENWRAVMAEGELYEEEMRLQRATGEYRWFLVRTAPFRDESGKIVKWYGVCTDIDDRKRAEEQLKATSAQLRALSASLSSAREEEATRIAREIHDELGATLTTLRWDLEELGEELSAVTDPDQAKALRTKVSEMMKISDATVNTVRRIASELRPVALDTLGLGEAIEFQAREFHKRTGITVVCDCSQDSSELSPEQATAVFRIFQEAMTNILRHAEATSVEIQLKEESSDVILTIKDNGRGITEEEKSNRRTLGLLGMRERAHLLGGGVAITGSKEEGTQIVVRIPLNRAADAKPARK